MKPDFKDVQLLIDAGNIKLAVDIFYDIVEEDDKAILSIPTSIGSNELFSNALLDVFEEKWESVGLGVNSQVVLLNHYILGKRWKDFHNDNNILIRLKRLEQIAPNDEGLVLAMANFYYYAGLFLSAYQCVKRLEERFVEGVSADVSVQQMKLDCLMQLGWEESVEDFFSNRNDVRTVDVLVCEAAWRREHGEYDCGVRVAREALLASGEDNVQALFELGANLFFGGDVQTAEKDYFPTILAMAEYDRVALYYSCFVHIYLGERDAAIRKIGSILEEGTAEAYYTGAEVFALLNEFELATDCLEKAEALGFVGYKCVWDDCAFRQYRETPEGAEVMKRLYGKLMRTDMLECIQINVPSGDGELVAYADEERHCFTARCMMYKGEGVALLSTGCPQTIVDWEHLLSTTGLYGPGNCPTEPFDTPYKCFVPGLGPVKTLRTSIPKRSGVRRGNDAYLLQGSVMMPQQPSIPGGILLGLDRIGSLSRFVLKSGAGTEESRSYKHPFRFFQGFYMLKATLIGQLDYNSDSVDVQLVVDTNAAVSSISRWEYDLINEDGAFPTERNLYGTTAWDIVRCKVLLGSEVEIENVEFVIVDEYSAARLGFDVLSRFKSLEFSNEDNVLTVVY